MENHNSGFLFILQFKENVTITICNYYGRQQVTTHEVCAYVFSMRVYVMCMCLCMCFCMYAPTHQTLAFAYNYAAFGYQVQLIQLVDIYESGIRRQAV